MSGGRFGRDVVTVMEAIDLSLASERCSHVDPMVGRRGRDTRQRMMECLSSISEAQHASFHVSSSSRRAWLPLRAATTSLARKCGRSRKSLRNIAAQAIAWASTSGLSALELCLRVYGIGPGDEVITSSNTFIATAMAISATGATPILVDPCEDDFCLDPTLLVEAITPRTRR